MGSASDHTEANLCAVALQFGQCAAGTRRDSTMRSSTTPSALELKPGHAKTLWNLGICHLLRGDFREGWRLFECRQDAQEVFFDRFSQPRWNGESLAGKKIVLHAEQGLGDEVLFASCFPEVIRQVASCTLICDPRLERLFARSFPKATVRGWLRRKDWSPMPLEEHFDVQLPAGSLPLYFRNERSRFSPAGEISNPRSPIAGELAKAASSLGLGTESGHLVASWRQAAREPQAHNSARRLGRLFSDTRRAIREPPIWRRQRRAGCGPREIRRANSRLGRSRSARRYRRLRGENRRARSRHFGGQCDGSYRRGRRHARMDHAADGSFMALDDRRRREPLVRLGPAL